MNPNPTSPVELAALIEQACRHIHATDFAEGLYPAQWTALRYFSEAPAPDRITAGLARFQGMSLGPVARTVRTLVDKGLLVRESNPRSRRADLISVTPSGLALLARDPRVRLIRKMAVLAPDQRETFAACLLTLIREFQRDDADPSPKAGGGASPEQPAEQRPNQPAETLADSER